MKGQFNTTVLGGLPVTIKYITTGYDNTDIGLGYDDVDDWYIVAIRGSRVENPKWIYEQLTSAEEDRIYNECEEHKNGVI